MYHPLVHLLDLCIFSYHLHSQTLIWPMDPYYEQWSSDWFGRRQRARRKEFMRQVHQVATPANYFGLSGPASLNSAPKSNLDLDPIIADYSQINPWRPSVVRPNKEQEGWILYKTPQEITGRINTVYMVRYDPSWNPYVSQIPLQPPAALPPGTDWLYCFEGGTGGIPRNQTVPAWSMMGLVLAREDDTAPAPHPYDLYIVFRGSRSGDPRLGTALGRGTGNPDWVTDMDFGFGSGGVTNIPAISATGSVCPGFAASVQTMLPTIMECLEDIQTKKQSAPRTIYVTGHSLGAALAVHFTSAVLLGTTYGHAVNNTNMPATIQGWPWHAIQLVVFASPIVGGETFQRTFNQTVASHRVYLKGDPITQTLRHHPVGLPYEIDPDKLSPTDKTKIGGSGSPLRHEPCNIREYLIKDLQQQRVLGQPLPAGFPAQEPWKIFTNFKAVLAEPWNSNDYVSQILGMRFSDRLVQYLKVLETITSAGQEKQHISNLLKAIPDIDSKDLKSILISLQVLCEALEDIFGERGSNFTHFFGLCLFLSVASTRTYGDTLYWAKAKPFVGLPLT